MEKPLSLISASCLGFLSSVPLAAGHALLFFDTWQANGIAKKGGYKSGLNWDSPELWIMVSAFAFSILMMILAVGLLRTKEWARQIAVYVVVPYLVALIIATSVALAGTPAPALAVDAAGIYLVLLLWFLLPVVPIVIWWQILLTRRNIRSLFPVPRPMQGMRHEPQRRQR